MPVKIESKIVNRPNVEGRLDIFRKTIPDGQGYTLLELADHPDIQASGSQIRKTVVRKGWSILQYDDEKRHPVHLVVNPKTLAAHAKKH